MSAQPISSVVRPGIQVRPMRSEDLLEVARIEARIFEFPWTYGNFADSLAAGYDAWVMHSPAIAPGLLGYAIVMWVPDEVHLLNLSVDASVQGQGLGGVLIDWLIENAWRRGARSMLLEVRPSNTVALQLYARKGFRQVGLRRRYYPAAAGTREDALVMVRRVEAQA